VQTFIKWPDGQIGRPVMLAWQDVFSGMILAHRVGKTESTELIRLSCGDMAKNSASRNTHI